ncbi:MAG: hypothetical protein EA385_13845, partial [Salinarimonadaceae bacterium]
NFWNWANPLPRLLGTDDARTNAWTARPRAVLDRINSEAGLSGDQRIAMNDDGVVNLPNSREGGQVLASMFYAQDGLHGSHNNAYGQFDIDELARQQGLSPDFVAGFNSARRQILNGEALAAGQTLAYGLAAAAPRLAGTPRVSTNVRLPGSTMQSGAPTHATANAPRIPIVRTVPNSPASPASPAPGNVRLNPGAAAAPPTGAGGLPPATARPQIPAQTGIDARNATIDVPATVIPNTPSVGSPAPVGQRRLPGTPPPSIPDVRTSDSIVRPAAPVLQFPNAPGVAPPGVAAPGASPALPATGLPGSLSTTPRPAPVVPAPTAPNLGNAGAARPRPVAPNTLAPNAAAPNPAASSAIPLATTPQPAVTPQTGSLQTGSAQTQPLPQSGPATAVRDRPAPTLQFETPTTPGTLANGGSANVAPPAAASATGDGATGNATPGAPTTPLATPGAPPAPTIPGAGAPIGLSGANPSPTPPVPPSGAGAPVTPDTDALNAAGDSEPTTDNVDGAANNPPRNPPISLSPQNPEPGDSSAITPSTQTGRPGTSGTQIEAFETGIPPIDPSDIQVGRTRAAPATANPATPARIAEAVRAANPDAEVQLVHGGTIAEVTYVSGTGDRAQTRTALVGNYQDIRDYNPELARAANQYLPNQSLLYDGRSPESVDQVFEGADISVMIADPAGRPIGMANLTYQTALYRDGSTGPVLYLAQVAGERGGGSQATAMLHDIARAEGTSMTASAFPGNVWNPPSERFPGGRSGLYGPNPSPGNPEPDAMIAWQASDTNPIDANGVPNPPRISLNPDRFGPDQPLTANPDGTSIFAPMHPFPVEPFPQNLGTAHGRPLTQTYENGMYSVRLGDDPNPVASAGRPFSIEQFEQAGSRPRQALDARAEAAGIATGDPTLAFVPEQNPTIDPGTSLRNADRVKYTWLYGAEDPDNLSVDDLPAFVFLDDRLGDQPIRHPFDPNQPDRPGNPNRPSSVFGQPYPDQPPANHAGPQSNISGPEGAGAITVADTPTMSAQERLALSDYFNANAIEIPGNADGTMTPQQREFFYRAIRDQMNAQPPVIVRSSDSGLGGSYSADQQYIQFDQAGLTNRMQFIIAGDQANSPYGNRDEFGIRELTYLQMLDAQQQGVDVFLWNCNTASIRARDSLRDPRGVGPDIDTSRMRVVILVDETSDLIASHAQANGYQPAAIIGTAGTVNSHAYRDQVLEKTDGRLRLQEVAAPNWATIVDSQAHLSTDPAIRESVMREGQAIVDLVDPHVGVVYYCCTHYPALDEFVQQAFLNRGMDVVLIDPAQNMGERALEAIGQIAVERGGIGYRNPELPGVIVNTSAPSASVAPAFPATNPKIYNQIKQPVPIIGGDEFGNQHITLPEDVMGGEIRFGTDDDDLTIIVPPNARPVRPGDESGSTQDPDSTNR